MDNNTPPSKTLLMLALTGWSVFVLGIIYILITTIGLLAINLPGEPIGQPYFTVMELLILIIAPLMAVTIAGVYYCAGAHNNVLGLAATGCMFIMAGITCCVHFLILSFEGNVTAAHKWMFAFRWPSVVYVLDIVAWDWFFPLAMFFMAPLYKSGRMEKTIQRLAISAGLLSLAGLLGIPTGNMQLRNIGVIGYGVLGPVIFLLIAILSIKKASSAKQAIPTPISLQTKSVSKPHNHTA